MSIGSISAASVQPAPPQAPADAKAAPAQATQDAQKAVQALKTDTVTISKQAVQLANDGDTAAVEAKETAADKASEMLRGKK